MPLGAVVTTAAQRLAGDDPAAGHLLALCAHLGPEPIPTDLFTARPDLLAGPLAAAARREIAFGRTVAQLGRYGLARITSTGPLLHRLTQAVLRDIDPEPDSHQDTVEKLLVAAQPPDATARSLTRRQAICTAVATCEPPCHWPSSCTAHGATG